MTQKELLLAIEALPKEVQFALANSVLARLAVEGPLPISEQLKAEFTKREEAFFPTRLEASLGNACARNYSGSETSCSGY